MYPKYLAATMCLVSLVLSGCGKAPSDPPVPMMKPAQIASAPTTGSATDLSVPSAEAVLTPATQTKPDPAAGRFNSTMSRTQESTAMPLPGQNNDHSAPQAPASRASSP